MMSRCLHAPLVFLFAACQNQISLSLSLFSHFPSSACLCFPFPHLCLIYPFESSIPDSLFFFPFHPRLSLASFLLPTNIPCLIVAEGGCFEQTGSRIDIQIILLREIRRAIVSHP